MRLNEFPEKGESGDSEGVQIGTFRNSNGEKIRGIIIEGSEVTNNVLPLKEGTPSSPYAHTKSVDIVTVGGEVLATGVDDEDAWKKYFAQFEGREDEMPSRELLTAKPHLTQKEFEEKRDLNDARHANKASE